MVRDESELIDRIYEAAVAPGLWPAVLTDLAASARSSWAVLLARRNDAWTGWRISPNVAQITDAYLRSASAMRSQTTARLLAFNRPGFLGEHEVFTDEEYEADAFGAWAKSHGFHHGAATGILAPSGETAIVQVTRRLGDPPFARQELDRLDAYRPHFARAALLAARWKLEKLGAAAEALGRLGLPAVVLDANCRAVLSNGLAERQPEVVWLPGNAIGFQDRGASVALRQAVAAAARQGDAARSLPVQAEEGGTPLVVHLVPLRGDGRDLFDGGYVLLVLTPVGEDRQVDVSLVQGLFDLTAAESHVAAGVARGLSLDVIAARQGVSRETVRTQLRSVLAKTGTSRQAELAAKLARVRGPI